ncbi:MAG: cobalamin biosynthesis protein [Rhodocyclaceae bacterium]|nr:cobalamin biosynthesis protein [Rhodocyclaceae bacterium]
MTFLTLLVALLLSRLWPQARDRVRVPGVHRLGAWLERRIGEGPWAGAAWWACLGFVWMLFAYLSATLHGLHAVLGLVFDAAVLFTVLENGRDAIRFGQVHQSLQEGNVAQAGERLREWTGGGCRVVNAGEIARVAIERALLSAHRNVFGVSFWFVLLPGPGAAVAYALVASRAHAWLGDSGPVQAARRVLDRLDWLPARVTAIGFAIAGNFEDAAYCWRSQARQWHNEIEGILISSGAGAMGVKLGRPVSCGGQLIPRPELGMGIDPGPDLLQSAVELVWRTLVLCLALLALFSVSAWVSS